QRVLAPEYLRGLFSALFEQLPLEDKTTENRELHVDFVVTHATLAKNLLAECLPASQQTAKPVNLNALIESILPFSAAIEDCVQRDYKAGDVTFVTDEVALSRVLLNIAVNAESVLISQKERFFIVATSFEDDGKLVRISLSDNAGGIPPEILGKIFDYNFTTKTYRSGLGLAIAKENIEKRCGGTIEVESRHISEYPEDHGTTFTIRLPIARSSPNDKKSQTNSSFLAFGLLADGSFSGGAWVILVTVGLGFYTLVLWAQKGNQ
ncbi:unnamed protein product, partial [marine sediment metagenome]